MNWRRILVVGTVAGMLAVTGCSSNLPETNQGNRNGQRVVDAVNRRPDNYRPTRGLFGRAARNTTRGINRATHRATRGIGHTARNITDGVSNTVTGGRYTRVPNRSTNIGRPHGRIGHTFRYGHNREYARNLDGHRFNEHGFHGYDRGIEADVNNTNRAIVNNSVVRSNTARTTPNRSTNITNKTTPTNTVKRNTAVKPAASTKSVTPTRSNTAKKSTTTANTQTHTKPKHTTSANTAPQTTSNVTRSTAVVPNTINPTNTNAPLKAVMHNATHNRVRNTTNTRNKRVRTTRNTQNATHSNVNRSTMNKNTMNRSTMNRSTANNVNRNYGFNRMPMVTNPVNPAGRVATRHMNPRVNRSNHRSNHYANRANRRAHGLRHTGSAVAYNSPAVVPASTHIDNLHALNRLERKALRRGVTPNEQQNPATTPIPATPINPTSESNVYDIYDAKSNPVPATTPATPESQQLKPHAPATRVPARTARAMK